MSMTLYLWAAPAVRSAEAAAALVARHESGALVFDPHPGLAVVETELCRQFPLDAPAPTNPWADGPERTPGLLSLSLRWGGDDAILDTIVALARAQGLLLYDPQGPDVYLPDDPPVADAPPGRPLLREWIEALSLSLALLALVIAALFIPIGWLRWLALLISGFLFLSSLIIVAGLVAAHRNVGEAACQRDDPPV